MNRLAPSMLVLFVWSLCPHARAQSYHTTFYAEGDGLTLGTVVSMAQDGDGRIWVNCRGGLMTFDGKDWRQLKGEEEPPLRVDHIRADHTGGMWASTGSPDTPILKRTTKGWQGLPAPPGYQPGEGEGYPFRMVAFAGEAVPVLAPRQARIWYHAEGRWHVVDRGDTEPGSVRTMDVLGDTVYTAGSIGLGRLRAGGFDTELNALLPEDRRNLLGVAVEGDTDGPTRIWILGPQWLGYLEDGAFHYVNEVPVFARVAFGEPYSLMPDGTGGLFFGYAMRLFHTRTDDRVIRRFGTHTGMGADGGVAMLRDREHHYWISALHGMTKIADMRFANFDKKQGLPSDEVCAVNQWPDGQLLLAQDTGFSLYDGSQMRRLAFRPPQDMLVRPFHIHKGPDGAFWVPTLNLGLLHLSLQEEVVNLIQADEPLIHEISDVLPRADAPPIVATTAGLRLLRAGRLTHYLDNLLDTAAVRRIVQLRDGTIAVATRGDGMWQYKDDTWRHFPTGKQAAEACTALFEDSRGRFLVGTFAGLYVVTGDHLEPFAPEALGGRTVYFITEDHEGRLWVGIDNGVFRLDGAQVRHYTGKNGLNGVETNRGAGFVDASGRVWIGTDRGVSRYQPAYDFPEQSPSALQITRMESGGNVYDPNLPVTLNTDRNDLIFHFQVISFVEENSLLFQSWLEGYDMGPLQPYKSETRSYRYTSLPPGRYTFHIRVRSEEGTWSPTVSSATVVIPKPFWARAWFVGLVLFLVLAICYTVFDYLSSKRYSRFLEKQVADRTTALSRKTLELEEQISASRRAEAEVQELNEELEARVHERTTALQNAQRDLVENAHYAGMAEIANSIIHNVGNILNSVSTSAFLIRQTVEDSKMTALLKANALLEEHLDDPARFLLEDPRGRQLLRFYLSLGAVFRKERERLTRHAELLMEKIDAIKDVVAQQHNYASGVYQNEELDPRELIDTSIKILESGLDSHGIQLVRDYHGQARAIIQRTKFIHILVNLLKNAKESILSEGGQQRKITVTVTEDTPYLFVRVKDTGLGIPPEHLKKIFNHGFTTKTGGHGFGLHSSANAVQEMGGAMWAESEGVGRGAVFVLRLALVTRPATVS